MQFNAALDLRTDFFQAYSNLSSALLEKGDAKEAVRAARQAVRFAPTISETYRVLAHALDANGDADGAVKQMRKALELDPGRADLHDELGTLLVRGAQVGGGTKDGAAGSSAATNSAATADPTKLKEAESEYLEALRLQPELAQAHLHLGVLRFEAKALG